MQHAAVLHIRVRAHSDRIHVAAQDGIHPDAGVLAENYIADDLCRVIDITRSRDGWRPALIRTNHLSGCLSTDALNVNEGH
jgi:hypothetical protein